jgi:hypothetical protein
MSWARQRRVVLFVLVLHEGGDSCIKALQVCMYTYILCLQACQIALKRLEEIAVGQDVTANDNEALYVLRTAQCICVIHESKSSTGLMLDTR